MFKRTPVTIVYGLTVFAMVFCPLSANAQNYSPLNKLFSPTAGRVFYEIAYELAEQPEFTTSQIHQALIFLNTTTSLDSRAKYVLADMITLLSQDTTGKYSQMLLPLLNSYVDETSDLEPVRKAVRHLLDLQDSREQREELLAMLLQKLNDRNQGLHSELATMLGLLMAEKTAPKAAPFYFMQAYGKNKYNRLAFQKFAELMPEKIEAGVYLQNLRYSLAENPFNLNSVIAFAQYAEQLQLYSTAADAYGYASELFTYLYPAEPMPASIYLPWIICSYNSPRGEHRCLRIANDIRKNGTFDMALEAIAVNAAKKIGDTALAKQLLIDAEQKALENTSISAQNAQTLAWFYCFAADDSENALYWANKAYSIEPNSPSAATLLSYSLVANGQIEWAKAIIENYPRNQIADLAMAQIQLQEEQKDSAIATLKEAIEKDSASLEAEKAKAMLVQLGSEYIGPADTEMILSAITATFGKTVVPDFLTPDKIIDVTLNLRGAKFSYGAEFGPSVIITNNSELPLVVSENGLFSGNIRIDAKISGDMQKDIPKVVSKKIQPPLPIEPGQSLIAPVRLRTGQLNTILQNHPQASLDVEFTVYLDPVEQDKIGVSNRYVDIKPAKVTVKRNATEINTKYLQNRIDSITKGRQGQKIKSAQLFVGLLAEQNAMAGHQPMYKFTYADWMPEMLKSALLNALNDDDWVVRVHTMAAMYQMPLDYDLIEAVSDSINSVHWPARLIALAILAKNQNQTFSKVLDWTAKYDDSQLVREMAIALGATPPPRQPPRQQQRQQQQP